MDILVVLLLSFSFIVQRLDGFDQSVVNVVFFSFKTRQRPS